MLVATFNVNGIRAAMKRGFTGWGERRNPDVLCLQEVRAPEKVLADFFPDDQWCRCHHESTVAGAKGRAGVAILAKTPCAHSATDTLGEQWNGHGRWVESNFATSAGLLTVISAYVHSGEVDTPKQDAKYEFLETVTTRLDDLLADDNRHVLLTGDINIGHQEFDIKNWKGNLKRAGFLPEERAYLDTWTDKLGLVDVVRTQAGDSPGPYSWWSWRGQAFDNDAGWRIDYQLVSPGLAERVTNWGIDRDPSYAERISDHAPVWVDYDMDLLTEDDL